MHLSIFLPDSFSSYQIKFPFQILCHMHCITLPAALKIEPLRLLTTPLLFHFYIEILLHHFSTFLTDTPNKLSQLIGLSSAVEG